MNKRLWALASGSVAMGTGSLVVAGVLAPIATDLGVSTGLAGQLVTAYALAFALGAPLLASALGRMCRRRVLLLGLALFTAGSALGAVAPSFGWLVASRVLAGVGAALFTPNATVVAATLVPAEQRGRAIATVFGGFTIASVFGVPLGTWLGLHLGWRPTLALSALLGVLAWVLVAWQVRGRITVPPANLRSWLAIARDPQALAILATTGVAIAGTYAVFSYVGPYLAARAGATPDQTALWLMLFGAAGTAGTWLTGRHVDRVGPARMAAANLGLVVLGLLLLTTHASGTAVVLLGLLLWGGGVFAVNAAQQARLVAHAPQLSGALLPANASVLYLGQAAGGGLGGWWLANASGQAAQVAAALHQLAAWGAGLVVLALVISLLVGRLARPSAVPA
jgi:predicted MFS family arabinose efflux permease